MGSFPSLNRNQNITSLIFFLKFLMKTLLWHCGRFYVTRPAVFVSLPTSTWGSFNQQQPESISFSHLICKSAVRQLTEDVSWAHSTPKTGRMTKRTYSFQFYLKLNWPAMQKESWTTENRANVLLKDQRLVSEVFPFTRLYASLISRWLNHKTVSVSLKLPVLSKRLWSEFTVLCIEFNVLLGEFAICFKDDVYTETFLSSNPK